MIKKLPQSVINQISAGEVIQRPCNVIKQLVQNSIDADSTQINITLQQGGLQLIKIVDNGKGIMGQDFPLLCARFATSKIKDMDDLKILASFGFRGEALASLSYVSNLTVSSKYWKQNIGHVAQFKNQMVKGQVTDQPIKAGTCISAAQLFYKSQARRQSLNPMQQKKRIYKMLSHFCLHYPQIRFNLFSQKGNQQLPKPRPQLSIPQQKMQIFQQITKLSYDKFSYISLTKIGHSTQIQGITTKLNCGKGRTLMLNINNRIVQSNDVFKAVEKAYSQCYQSIHEQNQTFQVYLSLTIQSKLIDCNVHPTKKSVNLFAGQQIFDKIRQVILNQIKKDSAIKILRASTSQPNTIFQSFKQKMNLSVMSQKQSQNSSTKSKPVYAFQKNRTDSKQLPITFYSQPIVHNEMKDEQQESQTMVKKQIKYFTYHFQDLQKNDELKKFFTQCSYVGCYGLSCILIHFHNKLYMMNMIDIIGSYILSFCVHNSLVIRQPSFKISIIPQIYNFIQKTNLLVSADPVAQWITNQQNMTYMQQNFGLTLCFSSAYQKQKQKQNNKMQINLQNQQNKKQIYIVSYPCVGAVFNDVIGCSLDKRIAWQASYLIVRAYYNIVRQQLDNKLKDKLMKQFLKTHFIDDNIEELSPFNQKISNFYKSKVLPTLKTSAFSFNQLNDPFQYMQEMLDLKDIYKVFQRC